MVRNLTQGAPWKHILSLTLPLLLGNIFQASYNLVDTMIVGRFVGPDALAGIGIASPVFNLLNALLIGLSAGSSILVSQLFGGKREEELPQAVSTVLWMSLGMSVLLTLLGQVFARPLLSILQTPDEAFSSAELYLRVILAGLVCNVFYNQLTGLLRGLGNTRTPMYFLIFCCFVNGGLDLVFVCVLHMGVAGAAMATILAEGLSAALTAFYIFKDVPQLYTKGYHGFDRKMYSTAIRFGLPMGLQQASISFGHVLMQGIINPFGTALIDGYTAASKVDSFAVMPVISLGSALSTFSAQNSGGGDDKRVHQGFLTGCWMAAAVGLVLAALVTPFRTFWIGLFVSAGEYPQLSADIISAGSGMLAVTPLFYWMLGLIHTALNTMAGAGNTKFSMEAMIGMMLLRIVIAWSLITFADLGAVGIWWSFPISWAITLLITWFYYGKWKKNKERRP